jgi:hypothetical protein
VTEAEKITAAIDAHTQWFVKLCIAIHSGTSQFKPEIVRTDDNCEFGKWLRSDFPDRNMPNIQEIKLLHAKFHQQAAEVLALAITGKRDEALKLLEIASGIRKSSTELVGKLMQFKTNLELAAERPTA